MRYGYRRIHTLLQREGWLVNHKRVYRFYCLEGLQMPHKPPRRRVSAKLREGPGRGRQAQPVLVHGFYGG